MGEAGLPDAGEFPAGVAWVTVTVAWGCSAVGDFDENSTLKLQPTSNAPARQTGKKFKNFLIWASSLKWGLARPTIKNDEAGFSCDDQLVHWFVAEVALVPATEIPDDISSLGAIYSAYQALATMACDLWREIHSLSLIHI